MILNTMYKIKKKQNKTKQKWYGRLSFTFKGLLGPFNNLFRRITAQITSCMLSFAVSALVQAPLTKDMYQYYYHIIIKININ